MLCVCVCVIYWHGPDSPRLPPQRQSGLDYHFTDRVPLPYMVTSFIHEMETDLINEKFLLEIGLLSVLRHQELIDSIS